MLNNILFEQKEGNMGSYSHVTKYKVFIGWNTAETYFENDTL